MYNLITRLFIVFLIIISSTAECVCTFGYLDYSTRNIGDDIQSIAAKRFLPKNRIPINRDFIGNPLPETNTTIHTIMNGWFMHTQQAGWPYPDLTPPKTSWPPSAEIDPLFVSFHLTRWFLPEALSEANIRYLIDHGPIGTRDYWTLQKLTQKNIPCYFSGCLTLTLENTESKRDRIIYAVDLDAQTVEYIKSVTDCPVECISHIISQEMSTKKDQRLAYAKTLLKKYQRARCVITSRLHAAMPCLAFKTPVLLLNTQPDQYRFTGLNELVRNCSREAFLQGESAFDLNQPPENPTNYIGLRENLIQTVSKWVNDMETRHAEDVQPPASLHVLIASIGRHSLLDMLDGLQPQLHTNDYLTVIFDAQDVDGIYQEVQRKLAAFSCSCSLSMETKNLGFWGHGIRNKHNRLKGDFIMHADDDDAYTADAFDAVRQNCTDRQTLYIFQMQSRQGRIIGKRPGIQYGNIGTPMGVIPSAYNSQSIWQNTYGGDFSFYQGLQPIVPEIKFIDQIIYLTRPQSQT